MDLLIAILKLSIAIYPGARILSREPAKAYIDGLTFKINGYLSTFKDTTTQNALWNIYTLLGRTFAFLSITFILTSIFAAHAEIKLPSELLLNWLTVTGITFLLWVSVPWNLDHRIYIKKLIFGSPLLLIPLTPILSEVQRQMIGVNFMSGLQKIAPLASLHQAVGGNEPLFAAALSGIFFVAYIAIPYVFSWAILFPIFYIFMGLISLMQRVLRFIHIHLHENLLDAIMAILAILVSTT